MGMHPAYCLPTHKNKPIDCLYSPTCASTGTINFLHQSKQMWVRLALVLLARPYNHGRASLHVPTGCIATAAPPEYPAPGLVPKTPKLSHSQQEESSCPWTKFTSRWSGRGPRARRAPPTSTSTSTYQLVWRVTRGGVGSGTTTKPTWHVASRREERTSLGWHHGGQMSNVCLPFEAAGLRHSICCFPTVRLTSLV
jgi:hypothetical protein